MAAVSRLAGIGKTALVLQTAAQALSRPGWFPGGVLFVDLFGYDPDRRLSPEEALDGLLRDLGMPGEHIPTDLQDRARLYRRVLAALPKKTDATWSSSTMPPMPSGRARWCPPWNHSRSAHLTPHPRCRCPTVRPGHPW